MDKLLSLTNYKQLVWAGEVDGTLASLPKFYTFDSLGIKNRYFVIKNFRIDFFTETGAAKIIAWEAAYDNTSQTVNTNTRYSLTNNANILLSEKLLMLQKITAQLYCNGVPIINNDNYSPVNFNFNIEAFVPTKIQQDFDLKMKTFSGTGFKDILGTAYLPFAYAIITGFSLDDNQFENLQAGGNKIQDVAIVDKKYFEPHGSNIPSQSISRDAFIKKF